ncbi:7814_t:CDS:2 [Ambispora gerdemannii]|uniref:7814_t:CDS:1 n=1 Tax=Ambispora gerdemannii TaxID=144530 RepID=A0A9N8VV05_9GLOM|nr:7814_t:CDS:2 [Ambispora gerdemannii]
MKFILYFVRSGGFHHHLIYGFPRSIKPYSTISSCFYSVLPQEFVDNTFKSHKVHTKGFAPSLFVYNSAPPYGGETAAANTSAESWLSDSGTTSPISKQCNFMNQSSSSPSYTLLKENIKKTFLTNNSLKNGYGYMLINNHVGCKNDKTLLMSSLKKQFISMPPSSSLIVSRCKRTFFVTRRLYSTAENIEMFPKKRPTKAELLANSNGFFDRLMIRIKLLLMRQVRPFTMEDIMALFSWVFVGNTLFIVIGTTTFVSLILAAANTLRFQEFIARRIGNYLTRETGITVIFESAIVPHWRDGKIRLKNVSVKRLPYKDYQLPSRIAFAESNKEIDTTLSMFDLTIEMIDVELSFMRWLDGKGLVKNATMKGIRGVIDRSDVHWDPSIPYNPSEWRRKPQNGDFELESLLVEDLLITVYQPEGFRPYNVSIFTADLRQFRKQWLLYDILSAENIVGMFDNCLFSVHRPQMQKTTTNQDLRAANIKKKSSFRVDGLNIDHLNTGVTGPFGWITSGTVDIRADVMFPIEPNNDPIVKIVNDIVDKIDNVVVQQRAFSFIRNHGVNIECEPHSKDNYDSLSQPSAPVLTLSFEMKFHDIKASVPLMTPDLSYMNAALIRSIVAYMNNNKTVITIQGLIVKPLSDFDGSWTLYDCSLVNDFSIEIGKGFANLTMNAQKRNRQLKRVGLWGLQSMTKNIANIWDYATGHRGFWHYVGNMPI